MSTQATGTFEGKSWDEKTWDGKPWDESAGAKLTRALITNQFEGDIKGEGTLQYLMAYAADGSATFIGLEQVVGRIGGRSGSFVLQHSGVFEDGKAKGSWQVVPGSGTGELRGLRGQGGFVAEHGQTQTPFTLDYHFETQ